MEKIGNSEEKNKPNDKADLLDAWQLHGAWRISAYLLIVGFFLNKTVSEDWHEQKNGKTGFILHNSIQP